MKPDISFFLGGIRPQYWSRLYHHIVTAIAPYTFELVICGPNMPNESSLNQYKNFKYIRDFGSCSRGAQIAAINCEAEVITLSADDGTYLPGSMAKALEQYRAIKDPRAVIGLRYEEGGNKMYEQDWYWRMKDHDAMKYLPFIPDDTPMSLNSLISRELFYEIGGYDCSLFETCNWGGHDLMIRLHKYGIKFEQFKQKNLSVDWAPGSTPEHYPIELADHPDYKDSNYHTFRRLYSSPNSRIKTDVNSWRQAESVWSKRFK